jgi:dihydroorotase-like cyclic amidohydrolase
VGRSNEIKEGETANLLLLSLEGKTTVSENALKSKAKNTPCIGMTLGGKIMLRVIGGKLVE